MLEIIGPMLAVFGVLLCLIMMLSYISERRAEGEDVARLWRYGMVLMMCPLMGMMYIPTLYLAAMFSDYTGNLYTYVTLYLGAVIFAANAGRAMVIPRLMDSLREDRGNFSSAVIIMTLFEFNIMIQLMISVLVLSAYGAMGSDTSDFNPVSESLMTSTILPQATAAVILGTVIKDAMAYRVMADMRGALRESITRAAVLLSVGDVFTVLGLLWVLVYIL